MTDPEYLDALLDAAVLEGAMAAGRSPLLAAQQFGASRVIAAAAAAAPVSSGRKGNLWSADDVEALRQWAAVLPAGEIAERLGRSVNAVRVKAVHLGLPMVFHHPDYLTIPRVARILSLDPATVRNLIRRDVLPAERVPTACKTVWRIRPRTLYAWALNPVNWIYFNHAVRDPSRLGDERLRRMIRRRAETWLAPDGRPDEWLTTKEVAVYHGVAVNSVDRYIYIGRLPAVRWGNWWIRRSDAMRPSLRFFKGKGSGLFERGGTAAGDAFIVLARAVGIPFCRISLMAKRSRGTTRNRWEAMRRRRGYIPWLIQVFDMPVRYREADDAVWTDWRPLAHRFPQLARDWAAWKRGESLDVAARSRIAGVLRSAAVWAGATDTVALLSTWSVAGMAAIAAGERVYQQLTEAGEPDFADIPA